MDLVGSVFFFGLDSTKIYLCTSSRFILIAKSCLFVMIPIAIILCLAELRSFTYLKGEEIYLLVIDHLR